MSDEPTNYKSCLLCGMVVPEDIVTCPGDGEASWSANAPTAPAEPPAHTPEVEPDPEPAPEPKKGKRK